MTDEQKVFAKFTSAEIPDEMFNHWGPRDEHKGEKNANAQKLGGEMMGMFMANPEALDFHNNLPLFRLVVGATLCTGGKAFWPKAAENQAALETKCVPVQVDETVRIQCYVHKPKDA